MSAVRQRGAARRARAAAALAAVLGAAAAGGCAPGRRPASYLPVGASAWYGDHTNDGVVLTLRLDPAAAVRAVDAGLRAAGFAVAQTDDRRRVLRTAPRALGGDTTLAVVAEVMLAEVPGRASSVVVLTGTYDVPSRGLRRVPVLQRQGEASPPYARLRAAADTIRVARPLAP